MKILVVYYSMYGHVLKLAQAVVEGVKTVPGAEPVLRRAQEFPEVVESLKNSEHHRKAWDEEKAIPVVTPEDFRTAEGVLFGTPTRFGNMAAQMKRVIDGLGELWFKGELEGKPAGVFVSTATTHGGQETTPLTMMVPLLHLGMLAVGVPYSTAGMLHTEARGGTPYGATTLAGGDNSLTPAPEDLAIARALGRRVAEVAGKLRA
ncbi:NAD(P)H:quinone oxidoreductase [bacterium]|nr:NAD(P)H:quinone oxidoreductase [bacterium]